MQINYQEIENIQNEMEKQYKHIYSWFFAHDPYSVFYLKKSDRNKYYLSVSKFNKIQNKLQRINDSHPDWEHDYLHGLPTYYKLFNVQPNKVDPIKINLTKTILQDFNLISNEQIEKISNILLDKTSEQLYYDFIWCIRQILCNIDDDEFDITENHRNDDVEEFNNQIKDNIIQRFYGSFSLIQLSGIPSLYTLIDLKQTGSTIETIKKQLEKIDSPSKEYQSLYTLIGSILTNKFIKEQYDKTECMNRNADTFTEQKIYLIQSIRKNYFIDLDKFYPLYNEILKMVLSLDIKKIKSITISVIIDWLQTIDEGKDYFKLLGLKPDYVEDNFESELRKKFREKERTPEINRAYGVLKNYSKRKDYIWFMNNYQFLKLYLILTKPIQGSFDNINFKEQDIQYIEIMDKICQDQ